MRVYTVTQPKRSARCPVCEAELTVDSSTRIRPAKAKKVVP
jgi:hypothetical protein